MWYDIICVVFNTVYILNEVKNIMKIRFSSYTLTNNWFTIIPEFIDREKMLYYLVTYFGDLYLVIEIIWKDYKFWWLL